MKDERMLRAVPYIPHILEAQRRKEYIPAVAAPKIRPLHEEASDPPELEGNLGRKDSDIEILIVAKKGGEVYPALSQVKHRIKRNSTIVLLHNGMGVLSQVQNFWPEHLRPNILEGYSSHGISKVEEFTVNHWGQGVIHLAIAPRLDETDIFSYQSIRNAWLPPVLNNRHVNSDLRLESMARAEKYRSLVFVIQQLLSNYTLNCTLRAYLPDFYLIQLRRTVLHSILQTVGALQRCTNAELIENRINKRMIGKLLSEVIYVLERDPIIASSESYLKEFSFRSLYAQLLHVVQRTPNLTNSIQQDIAGKRELELNYHSGFFLRLARQRGLTMPTWRTMHDLVKSGAVLQKTRYNQFVPMMADGQVKDIPDWMQDDPNHFGRPVKLEENAVKEPYGFEELEDEGIEDTKSMDLDDSWVREYLKKSSHPIIGQTHLKQHMTSDEEYKAMEWTPQASTQEINTPHEVGHKVSGPFAGDHSPGRRDQPPADSRDVGNSMAPPKSPDQPPTNPTIAATADLPVGHGNIPADASTTQPNSVSPSSEPSTLPLTAAQNAYRHPNPLPNQDTPNGKYTTDNIYGISTQNEAIAPIKQPTVEPSLLQRLHQAANDTSNDLMRERRLFAIPNLRIKSKPYKNGKAGTRKGDLSEKRPSRNEEVSHGPKASEDTLDSGALVFGDIEMTKFIISTLSKESIKVPVNPPPTEEEEKVNPNLTETESTNQLKITSSVTPKEVITNKTSDTDILLKAMRIQDKPKSDNGMSDIASSTRKSLIQHEEGAIETDADAITSVVSSEEVTELATPKETEANEPVKKRRGRPPGSKNKLSESKD